MKTFFTKIIFKVTFVIMVFLIVGFIINKTQNSNRKYNLILISIDTLRADHMGVYGYPKNTTPNIDKWAKDATVFTNMKTIIPSTFPSFATLMTGISPFDSKTYNNFGTFNGKRLNDGKPISKETRTLAEILQKNGYTTAAFITNYTLDPSLVNINKGFQSYDFHADDPLGIYDKNAYKKFFSRSIDWIDKNNKKKFFLWIHLSSPHAPYSPPKELECTYGVEFCEKIRSTGIEELEKERKSLEGCHEQSLSSEKVELFKTLYDGEIAFDDKIIGDILQKIKERGLEKNTLVVFYADHGEGFDHNFYFSHGYVLYKSSTSIPFIVKNPQNNGRTVTDLLDNTKILPMVLDTLGIDYKNNVKDSNFLNKDILSIFNSKSLVFSTNPKLSKYSVSDERYQYIFSLPSESASCLYDGKSEELYDLKNDPTGTDNILSTQKEIAEKYKKILMNYLSKYNLPKMASSDEGELEEGEEINQKQQKVIEQLKSLGY